MTILYEWVKEVRLARKVVGHKHGCTLVHYTFRNGKKMIDEYSKVTGLLTYRGWKMGSEVNLEWIAEVGELAGDSKTNIVHDVTENQLRWQITDMFTESSGYRIDITDDSIVASTRDRSVSEMLPTPELSRVYLKPCRKLIRTSFSQGVLTITYPKLQQIVEIEEALQESLKTAVVVKDMSPYLI